MVAENKDKHYAYNVDDEKDINQFVEFFQWVATI